MILSWLTWIWSTPEDFTEDDVSLNNFPDLKFTDKKRTIVNQSSHKDFRSLCTGMSTISACLSFANKPEVQQQLHDLLSFLRSLPIPYIIWKWRDLKLGVSGTLKFWNTISNTKMMYVKTYIWSDFCREIQRKGYCVVWWHLFAPWLSADRKDNAVIDAKDYDDPYWWHAVCMYWSDRYSWKTPDTYPYHKNNIYEVKYWSDLVKNWIFYDECYAILPVGEYNIIEIKRKKRHEQLKTASILCYMDTKKPWYKKAFDIYNNMSF